MIAAGYSARDGRTGINRPPDAPAQRVTVIAGIMLLILIVPAVGRYVGVVVILSPTMG